ncbi:hypothetical protein C5167_019540, partial [Papaver somniferum]
AFQNVWMKVCQGNSTFPVFVIPSGKNFLLSPVTFKGPCMSPKIVVEVLGNIVAPDQISAWGNGVKHSWIDFYHINGLTVHGPGLIDGQGLTWWNQSHVDERLPAFKLDSCSRVELSRMKHINSPRNHISIHNCSDIIISNINITAPGSSHNTDGIDISRSTYIRVQDSFIGTGDDCIAINGGTSSVEITNVACGPGHGIRNLFEHHETCSKMNQYKVVSEAWERKELLKLSKIYTSKIGGSGYARHITFDQIKFVEVYNPITSAVEVNDVYYTRIYGTSKHRKNVINLKCIQDVPCTNIVMNQINIHQWIHLKK